MSITAFTRRQFDTDGTPLASSGPAGMMVLSPEDPLTECHLAGSRWVVTAIDEHRAPADVEPTIEFRRDGRIFGCAAVNRYTMDYVQDGWSLTVGLALSTRFVVAAQHAAFETRFLQCLETIRQFRRDEQTLSVIFETQDGREIRTRPTIVR